MVKKLEKLAEDTTHSHFVNTMLESANHIWLAGLGAFIKAQEEGTKMFDTLVKEGAAAQQRAQKVAGERVEEMTARATGAWDKLEQVFESRVARALESLGVPTKKDVEALTHRVAELSKHVEALSGSAPKPTKARAAAHEEGHAS